jgi:hypothetical protein
MKNQEPVLNLNPREQDVLTTLISFDALGLPSTLEEILTALKEIGVSERHIGEFSHDIGELIRKNLVTKEGGGNAPFTYHITEAGRIAFATTMAA